LTFRIWICPDANKAQSSIATVTWQRFRAPFRDRQRLRAIVADPKSPQKRVWRARIVLLSGACVGTSSIMAKTGKSKTCVWRWQERFMRVLVLAMIDLRDRPLPTKTEFS
jgi:hypothetical protein